MDYVDLKPSPTILDNEQEITGPIRTAELILENSSARVLPFSWSRSIEPKPSQAKNLYIDLLISRSNSLSIYTFSMD